MYCSTKTSQAGARVTTPTYLRSPQQPLAATSSTDSSTEYASPPPGDRDEHHRQAPAHARAPAPGDVGRQRRQHQSGAGHEGREQGQHPGPSEIDRPSHAQSRGRTLHASGHGGAASEDPADRASQGWGAIDAPVTRLTASIAAAFESGGTGWSSAEPACTPAAPPGVRPRRPRGVRQPGAHLPVGDRRGAGPARSRPPRARGRDGRPGGRLGVGQVDPAQRAGRRGLADGGPRPGRRPRPRGHGATRAGALPASRGRVRAPADRPQPRALPDVAAGGRPAADDRRASPPRAP